MSHALQNPPGSSLSQFPDPALASRARSYPSQSVATANLNHPNHPNHLNHLNHPPNHSFHATLNHPNSTTTTPHSHAPSALSEAYRANLSSTGSNGSSLPSMRTLDHPQQQPQQLHTMNSGLPPGPYYHNTGATLPHPYGGVTSDPNGPNMRYALPVGDSRVMSGGRHKKEIKRRTKTGCLTCRKRRIKCDEQHPTCRNCQKSKRECQGYDPIFKQQQNNPAPLQPAPSSAPGQPGNSSSANPYGHQPQMSGYGMPSNMAYEQSPSAGVSSPGSANQGYEYASAIDPALQAASSTTAGPGGYVSTQAKRSVAQLLALAGEAPPPSAVALLNLRNKEEETNHLYYSIYAPGLENFLESKWFSLKGLTKLLADTGVKQQFAILLYQFSKTQQGADQKEMTYTASVEARIVWAIANLVRSTAAETNGAKEFKTVPPIDDATEAGSRLTVFENLLTGNVATVNTLTTPVAGSTDHHRLRELEFWHTLGDFVCIREDDPESVKKMDETLSALRNLLDGRENRDVLYSIAVVRAIGPRVEEYTNNDTPLHFDESDNKSKLLVAKKFVLDEATGAGTTNVIRRLCELACRSWESPKAPMSAQVTSATTAAK
ncbi:hypothetical protein HYFRA_00010411 [Hymenoscyphus fraxineus]|uniref:Zn(2)-C6 fungal-type domain-containing protein n=1 Tax=Hymenoscyphus fraxineus TaxID=746836 RepID=A0A9N9PVS4_9HELO|nr:hypothetical protein HYFRA_00010411 [Hymenoscyphus fraxineus]